MAYQIAIERGKPFVLTQLRLNLGVIGSEWIANLRMDTDSLTNRPNSKTTAVIQCVNSGC